ncbi:hypothetical protein BH23PLA1_BH23PLA1_41110 [soil metagenome]
MSTLFQQQQSQSRVDSPNTRLIDEVHRLPISISEAEAPDRGEMELEAEAPETRATSEVEAPEAGEGRMSVLEGEFTHGRSQS